MSKKNNEKNPQEKQSKKDIPPPWMAGCAVRSSSCGKGNYY